MNLLTIKLINVTKKYRKHYVFRNFNLSIDNQRVNFLVSPNGTGKSTLIKIILRLIKFKGIVETNIISYSYCPEKVVLPDFLRVIDFLKLFNIDIIKTHELLDKFKINKDLTISSLSKGMHQKILIIQSLAVDSDSYFFDEPLSGLDKNSESIFINEVNKLYKLGKMIVISSHYIERYQQLNKRIIELG